MELLNPVREITAEQFAADRLAGRRYLCIDIREEADYRQGHLPDAVLMRAEDAAAYVPDPGMHDPLLICCAYGRISLDLAEELSERGVEAYSLKGGYGTYALYEIKEMSKAADRLKDIEHSLTKSFHTPLFSRFAKAIVQYELVKENDRIAVCISGGKDSFLMALLFKELKRHNKFPFELCFLVMDPGYNAENRAIIESNAKLLDIPIEIFESNIFDVVDNVKESPCYLCARMRRGYLYKAAKDRGCNKIALGHHFDDVIETTLMGMLYAGQYQAMMPKLKSTNFPGMELIRPLYFVREADIIRFRDTNGLHFIRCACHFTDTCSTVRSDGDSTSKRIEVKKLIADLKKTNPQIEQNLFRATENVVLDKVLGYKSEGVRHSFLENY
ncbi:MAG: ATPase [Lachnospiraceae bacterium]|nr:ATPase [Lachnospiraceae bacterium]